jgi:hypothetical protein
MSTDSQTFRTRVFIAEMRAGKRSWVQINIQNPKYKERPVHHRQNIFGQVYYR